MWVAGSHGALTDEIPRCEAFNAALRPLRNAELTAVRRIYRGLEGAFWGYCVYARRGASAASTMFLSAVLARLGEAGRAHEKHVIQ